MDYIICIPSYKRANICKSKTLNMLKNNNIDAGIIYVYVVEEEYEIYKDILDHTTYNKLVVGKKGIIQQRQFICDQYAEGTRILFLDDDVENVGGLGAVSLSSFIAYAFTECVKHKAFIWGVYPVNNEFFQINKKKISTDLTFIVGAFYGIINRPDCQAIQNTLTNEMAGKEDVERTLKYFINDGIVLRFNKIRFKTKYYGSVGGLGSFKDRIKPMADACLLLKQNFPEYGNIKVRKNGMSEFVLKKKPISFQKAVDSSCL